MSSDNSTPTGADPRAITVDFAGEVHVVATGDEFTFGRMGDLAIDENPHLHRVLGRFRFMAEVWWLMNEGSQISIEVIDVESRSNGLIAPGNRFALTFPRSLLRFRAGASNYELEATWAAGTDGSSYVFADAGDATITASDMPLTDDQRALLVALSEDQLRSPSATIRIPTNREMAGRLGWSLSKFERKLDNVAQKFAKAGVSGLHGKPGELAKDRRTRLVEYVLETGLVTLDDIDT